SRAYRQCVQFYSRSRINRFRNLPYVDTIVPHQIPLAPSARENVRRIFGPEHQPKLSIETMSQNITGNWRIDVHHHVVPPQYADDSMPIKLPNTETQLQSMDKWQIRTAITSLTPRVILENIHRLREVARTCNEFQARLALEHPSRFGAFALLPL